MPKILWKDLLVEIRSSKGRFLSILAIVALGVSFFAGIKASAPDMEYSADSYFDKYDVQDIQIYSTVGLDEEDIQAIEKLDGVEQVQGQFSIDALAKRGSAEQVIKVISLQDGQTMNRPRLVSGRMPEEPDECLLEASGVISQLTGSYQIGDRIRLYSGTDTPLSDDLEYTTFIVVGMAYNPNYLSYEKGTSTIGSGSVSSFIYIPQDAVKADYFTEIDVKVKEAQAANAYGEGYFDLIDPVTEELNDIAQTQVDRRIAAAQKKVQDAKEEMDKQLAPAQKTLEDSKEQLDDAAQQLADGIAEIQLNKDKLASSAAELQAGWQTYYSNKSQVEDGLSQVNAGIAQIESAQAQLPYLESQKSQLENALNLLPALNNGLALIERLQAQYDSLKDELDALQAANPEDPVIAEIQQELASLEARLDQAIAEFTGQPGMGASEAIAYLRSMRDSLLEQVGSVEEGKAMLQQLQDGIDQIKGLDGQLESLKNTRSTLLSAQSQLDSAYATLMDAQQQLDAGKGQLEEVEAQVEEGQKEYESGLKQYEEGKAEFDEKKAEAQEQIDDAQKKVDSMSGQWYVLDRNSHYSYRDYQSCAQRMDGIASVFPVFFFLVAALVCMTTMTRMVQEQRSQIGTLKALGYSRLQIAFKYMAYAGLASLLGCVIGCSVGMLVFPWIIFTAWNTMYNLEAIRFVFQPGLILLASGSVTLVVLLAALFSIYAELREVPSALMRPKAAKAGRKILLERIPWLWQKISFMHKVTLRNLFRYKKRFLMTVIGIAGCSALLVAGFGLNDSISDIVPSQFQKIYHYNALVAASTDENAEVASQIASTSGIEDVHELDILPVSISFDGKDVSANVNILEDPDSFAQFMTFIPMNGSEADMQLDDEGVFISVHTANKLNLSLGDRLEFKTADNQEVEAKVTGIFDQYLGHEIYCTQTLFDSWHIKAKPSSVFEVITTSQDSEFEDELGKKLMDLPGVVSVTFYSSLIDNFSNMISAIKMVVVVLVLSAAMLAFVVLYNLSNVNISERMREIATIKVLGFNEKEVNQYINRESLLLSMIGALCGLAVGIWLHNMIMNLAELDDVRFGRTILPLSFGLSFLLTMLFSLAVNWIMKFKLRKIEMVESLKAVE